MSFVRNIGKNISKNSTNKYRQKISDEAKQSGTDVLETVSSKTAIQKQLVIWLAVKLLIKLQGSQKFNHRMIYLQMKKKYLEKDMYISKS